MFPVSLPKKILECYAFNIENLVVLDPFMGSGSTLLATAHYTDAVGIGFDVVEEYINIAKKRLLNITDKVVEIDKSQTFLDINAGHFYLIKSDARTLSRFIPENSVNITITSPPYWFIHRRKRTADRKRERPYSDKHEDIGNIADYHLFLKELRKVYEDIYRVTAPKGYFFINVMDLREKSTFYPYHCDTISICIQAGFKVEDVIIWDRRQDYNNLKPLGYPHKFIINKVHECILVFRKEP